MFGVKMMEKYYMLFKDDKIYIKSNKSSKVFEYSLDNIIQYPNIPSYFSIFNNEKITRDLKMFIRKNLYTGNGFMKMISSKRIFLLLPDDVTMMNEVEKRAFDELARMLFGAKEVIIGSECAFVSPFEEKNHICISRTCRMMVISYTKDKNTFDQRFIENREYTNDELYAVINELDGYSNSIPKIYLNGANLSQYSDMGIIIDSLELINNFQTSLDLAKYNISIVKTWELKCKLQFKSSD